MRRPQLIGRTAEALTFGMVAFAFGVSSMALTALGVKYDEEGGSFVQKLHPATALAALALAADFASRSDRLAWLSSLPHRFPGLCYFAVTAVIAIIFAALVQGSPITPLVDTFFCGAAFLLLYSDASERFRRGTRLFLHSFMLINAIIAIAEFLTQMRLTPFVAGGHVILHDYRSTALLGHPLNNAAASAAYALLLLYGGDPSLSAAMRATLILFQIPALVAFGGRAATVAGVAFASIQLLRWTLELLCGRRFDLRAALIGAIALPAVIGGIFVTAQSGSLDAFVERFIDDKGSARARALMFQLYDFFPIDELLFGPDPARLAWVQNSLGIEYGIENSWLGLAFQYGALMALFFIAGFFALIWEFWRRSAPGAAIPIAFHLTLLSSASGVSVKTFMFNQFAILLLAFFGRRSEETASERRVVRLSPLARKSL